MTISCQIRSLGAYVPQEALTNFDLAEFVDTSDEWIVERTGISRRRRAASGQNTSDLGYEASVQALENAGMSANTLSHVIGATCTGDYLAPSIGCIIAGKLNTPPVMAFDIGAACAGFIYGLSVCRSILAAAPESNILLVCSEALTRRLNWKDRSTCVLFGDAAAACVVTASGPAPMCEVVDVICASDGSQKDLIIVGGGTSCEYQVGGTVDEKFFISMQGRDTYKQAVRHMVNICGRILEKNNLSIDDIGLFVPHQANMRIIEAVGSRLRIDPAKVFTNVASYGNTSSASIPLALEEARKAGRIPSHGWVLATAFGSGLTWGAALLKFE